MRTLYIDAFCGASGDMIVGALLDAGAPFETVREGLDSLGVHGFRLSIEKVCKKGITATQFRVLIEEHHHHPHRHFADIVKIIQHAGIPQPVKDGAIETFRRIAECEATVHGTTPEKVHFHEVGAVDSIVDIVGAHYALHLLAVERVVASPLNLGSGQIRAAHGVMPVPAPATVQLLAGSPCYASEVPHELTTPTGAALVCQWAATFGPMPLMRIERVGYGAGTRDLDDRANVLRVILGETAETIAAAETVTVIETDIDDMNPELLPPLVAELLEKGARDAFLTPILGKKGRPGYLVTVLCDAEKAGDLARVLFRSSTTFGVRMRHEDRICLDREWKTVKTPWGPVRVKIGRLSGEVMSMSPEFEDCRALAQQAGAPVLDVYDAARGAAKKGELGDV